MTFAIGVGIPLGYLAARRHGSWLDSRQLIGSLIGVTIPVFFLAYLLKEVFAVELGWLPAVRAGRTCGSTPPTSPTSTCSTALTREWDAAWDALLHLVLPGDRAGHDPAGDHRPDHPGVGARRGQRGLRPHGEAKGLATSTVRRRHILRNALLPVSTTIGLQTGLLLSGAVLTETVFAFGAGSARCADAIEPA